MNDEILTLLIWVFILAIGVLAVGSVPSTSEPDAAPRLPDPVPDPAPRPAGHRRRIQAIQTGCFKAD